eukprot:SAG31_NODE_41460_length_276_cov_0.576271_1_plen_30_part_10
MYRKDFIGLCTNRYIRSVVTAPLWLSLAAA